MAATFTKSKIMDMVNKAVSRAKNGNEQEIESMYYALWYVAGLKINRYQFEMLVHAGSEGVYRVYLREVTDATYEGWR